MGKRLLALAWPLMALGWVLTASALHAQDAGSRTRLSFSGKTLHLSCQKSIRDLNTSRLECYGNVYLRRPGELLTADYAWIDLDTEQMHAEGNVVYFTPTNVIYGAAMDFNFLNETGVIRDGRIESEKYQLLGDVIERRGEGSFRAQDGEYTTCRDCPASWKLAGRTVDLEVEQYAHLKDVYIRINDAPTMYLPYAIIPVKRQRQTGFLFPKMQLVSPNGFTYIQPFFWAISRSQDATISGGLYTRKGYKAEGQYRFMFTPRTYGELNSFYLYDRTFTRPYNNRWAFQYKHNVRLPFKIDQKLHLLDTSDRDYPRLIGDIPGRGEPALVSEGVLSRSGRDLSVHVKAKRIKNLLTTSINNWDKNTVQLVPGFSIATTDHRVSSSVPLHWGLKFQFDRFWRQGPSFDAIYDYPVKTATPSNNFFLPGQTPLRQAQRYNLIPELYYTTKLADVIEVIPLAQYRTFHYRFDENVVGPTSRGYLLLQNEVATVIERVYSGKMKHKIRPSLIYSRIPIVQQNVDHPFNKQIRTAGYQFDELDIVPITSDTQQYFVPLGNSIEYKVNNRFILKSDDPTPTYRKIVEVTSGQTFNFIELQKDSKDERPFSRFYTLLSVDMLRLSGTGSFYYYPYVKRSSLSVGAKYTFGKYLRRVMLFERSLGLRYRTERVISNDHGIGGDLNWSFNDYIGVLFSTDYDFPVQKEGVSRTGRIRKISGGVTYQSPSQCYKMVLMAGWVSDQREISVNFTVPINLTGDGFTDIGDSDSLQNAGGAK